MNDNKWAINCEDCGTPKYYSTYNGYYEATRLGKLKCKSCAGKKRWDKTLDRSKYNKYIYVGKRFGSLVVVSDRIGTGTQVSCKCDCGNVLQKRAARLIGEKNEGCQKCLVRNLSHRWKGIGKVPKIVFTRIKHHAIHTHKDFDITLKYISELFDTQGQKCALSGLDLEFGCSDKVKQTASLDRIDSTKGYIKGNVQWVHKDVNWMKQDFSDNEFMAMCKRIVKYRKV